MIRRRTNRSTPCCLLAALVCLATAHGAAAQTLSLISDDFEDSDAPQNPPWDELGSTGIETTYPIGDDQSLVFSSSLGGGAEEPDLICTNFTSSVVFMRAEFWVDLQNLDIPEGASFELISLYEGNGPMAVAVRLGQSNGEQWVSLEAGENGENFVGTPQHELVVPPRGQVLRHIKLIWDQGDAADGSASLEISDAFSTLTLDLVDLENSQLAPDNVRLGVGAPKPLLPASMGSFLLDDVVLRITQ